MNRFLPFVLLLTACDPAQVLFPPDLWQEEPWWDTGWRDTGDFRPTPEPTGGDTDPVTPPPPDEFAQIDSVSALCTASQDSWLLELQTEGASSEATVHLRGSTGRTETHGLVLLDRDPAGAWDRYQTGPLPHAVPEGDFEAGTNSAFDCADRSTMSFAAVTRDPDGAYADCVIWGADPFTFMSELETADPDLTSAGCVAY